VESDDKASDAMRDKEACGEESGEDGDEDDVRSKTSL
jgi:hypothetical protein